MKITVHAYKFAATTKV